MSNNHFESHSAFDRPHYFKRARISEIYIIAIRSYALLQGWSCLHQTKQPYTIFKRLELVLSSGLVQGRFEEVDVSFLAVHGGDDVVCNPACVEVLYSRADSKDKTLKIYDAMWHQLVGNLERMWS